MHDERCRLRVQIAARALATLAHGWDRTLVELLTESIDYPGGFWAKSCRFSRLFEVWEEEILHAAGEGSATESEAVRAFVRAYPDRLERYRRILANMLAFDGWVAVDDVA